MIDSVLSPGLVMNSLPVPVGSTATNDGSDPTVTSSINVVCTVKLGAAASATDTPGITLIAITSTTSESSWMMKSSPPSGDTARLFAPAPDPTVAMTWFSLALPGCTSTIRMFPVVVRMNRSVPSGETAQLLVPEPELTVAITPNELASTTMNPVVVPT